MGTGETWNTVQRQRLAHDEIDATIAEVRELLRARGRTRTQWEVGSSAEPHDLVEQLLARGLTRDKDPYAVALVLTHAPPSPPPGLVARRVETFDEFVAACAVQWEAFELEPEKIEADRALLPERWSETVHIFHAVWLDGEVVSAGSASPIEHGLLLYGGATVPRARGRGAYRALVGARWAEAVARGTPA